MTEAMLFPELSLKPGDTISGKGKRLFFRDIFKGQLFVQDHSGVFIVCRIEAMSPQITYNDGTRERGYTRPEYIDYEGEGFESCLFWRIPENWERVNAFF